MNLRLPRSEIQAAIKNIDAASLISLEKEYVLLEKTKVLANPMPTESTQKHRLWTRLIITIVLSIIIALSTLQLIPTIVNPIIKYKILKLGYQDIDDNYIKDQDVVRLFDNRLKVEAFKAGGKIVNGTIIPFPKDSTKK